MNPILLVIPILSLLMFDLGLTLHLDDFKRLARQPGPVVAGLVGQLVVLPAIAFGLAELFHLPAIFYVGLVLIACSPGGSSSNVFSMLAGGDVALSVTMTALSSLITLVTIPLILGLAVTLGGGETASIHLPVGNLLVQNIVLMFVPILLGVGMRRLWPKAATATERVLGKIAFPCLMLLAGIFFVQHYHTILDNIGRLGLSVTLLILLAIGTASLLSRVSRFDSRTRRTLVIEVGMQNAAQAIAVASSPFIFNNDLIAIPAIVYALMMNVVLLIYVGHIRYLRRVA